MKKQTVKDRVNTAVQIVVGDDISISIYKATTEEEIPPKSKHVFVLRRATERRSTSLAQMSTILAERVINSNYYVAVKALSVVHYLMINGDERFLAYIATDSRLVRSKLKVDIRRSDGRAAMVFAEKYLAYLKIKAEAYCELGFDVNTIPKGSNAGSLQHKSIKVLIPICAQLHKQCESIFTLITDTFSTYNTVASFALKLLKQEAIVLYLCYNDAAIVLIKNFFECDKRFARTVFNEYKQFQEDCRHFSNIFASIRPEDIANVPSVTIVSPSLLESMTSHLQSIETSSFQVTPIAIKKPEGARKTIESNLLDFNEATLTSGTQDELSDLFGLGVSQPAQVMQTQSVASNSILDNITAPVKKSEMSQNSFFDVPNTADTIDLFPNSTFQGPPNLSANVNLLHNSSVQNQFTSDLFSTNVNQFPNSSVQNVDFDLFSNPSVQIPQNSTNIDLFSNPPVQKPQNADLFSTFPTVQQQQNVDPFATNVDLFPNSAQIPSNAGTNLFSSPNSNFGNAFGQPQNPNANPQNSNTFDLFSQPQRTQPYNQQQGGTNGPDHMVDVSMDLFMDPKMGSQMGNTGGALNNDKSDLNDLFLF